MAKLGNLTSAGSSTNGQHWDMFSKDLIKPSAGLTTQSGVEQNSQFVFIFGPLVTIYKQTHEHNSWINGSLWNKFSSYKL